MTTPRKFFIVWNPARNEGFVTDSQADAQSVKTGRSNTAMGYFSKSTAGDAFREAYEGSTLKVQEIEIAPPRKGRAS